MNKTAVILSAAVMMLAGTLNCGAAPVIRGDINGDGLVNVADIVKVAAHVKNIRALDSKAMKLADLNFDGRINVTDISLLAAHVKGIRQLPSDPDSADETFEGYDAFLMFADSEWFWSNFSGQGYPEDLRADGAYGVDADVTGDGTYTVSITKDSIAAQDAVLGSYNPQVLLDENEGVVFPANGATVFCVDITGICDGTMTDTGEETKKGDQKKFTDEENYGVNKKARGKYTGQEISVTVDSIKADGKDVEFDDAKIVKGNIESDNNCYRLEIYNEYGKSKEDPAIDKSKLMFSQSLEVTFTITGLDKEDGAAEGDAAEATEEAAETAAE